MTTPKMVPDDQANALKRVLSSHPSLTRAAAAYALYEGTSQIYTRAHQHWQNRLAYSVTVSSDDARLYADVQSWVLQVLPESKQRSLVASTSRALDLADSPDSYDAKPPAGLLLTSNQRQAQTLLVDGFRVRVEVEESAESTSKRSFEKHRVIFRCRTRAAQRAVLAKIAQLSAQRDHREPVLRIASPWGGWHNRRDLPLRTLDSVILAAGQKERIVADLAGFLDDEHHYVKLGIPWHRGYMLHGPAGTGKSSLVKAIANHFRLDLFYVPLSDMKDEGSLLTLLADVTPRSIVLLEDIDSLEIARKRGGSKQGRMSTSSLLNALDGVTTPHGLVTFMTTNHFDRLDDALVRAGRMDVVELLGRATARQVEQLYRYFYGQDLTLWGRRIPADFTISQADVAELFKRHLHDPAAARVAIRDLVDERSKAA